MSFKICSKFIIILVSKKSNNLVESLLQLQFLILTYTDKRNPKKASFAVLNSVLRFSWIFMSHSLLCLYDDCPADLLSKYYFRRERYPSRTTDVSLASWITYMIGPNLLVAIQTHIGKGLNLIKKSKLYTKLFQ
jgi:hypothetical protein